MAFDSHIDIWHDNRRCTGSCGKRELHTKNDRLYSIRCLRHSTCGCRGNQPKGPARVQKLGCCGRLRICDPTKRPRITALWRTCRQLHAETIGLLYSTPIFSFDQAATFDWWIEHRRRNQIVLDDNRREQRYRLRGQDRFITRLDLPRSEQPYRITRQIPHLKVLFVEDALLYKKTIAGHMKHDGLARSLGNFKLELPSYTGSWKGQAALIALYNHQRLPGESPRKGYRAPKLMVYQVGALQLFPCATE